MEKGWIKLHSKILDWGWWDDANTFRLFIFLLLSANWEDKKWHKTIIKRGQVVAGRKTLSERTGLSEQNIRTALNNLKSTSEITIKSTNKYSIITIINYSVYQYNTSETNQQINQPTNHQSTTTKEVYNNTSIIETKKKGFIPPSLGEVKEYFKEKGFKESIAIQAWEYYDIADWKDSQGNKVKNWKQKMIAVWMKDENRIKPENRTKSFGEMTPAEKRRAII